MERVSAEESRVDARRCSTASALTGDDGEDHEIINRLKMEALEPLKEDLSEWLVNLLGQFGSVFYYSHRWDSGDHVVS